MPAFSTHYIFALEMMEELKHIADFSLNENAVSAGTQGPDIFFFHRAFPWQPGKPLRKLGSALHRAKPARIMDRLYEYCASSRNPDIAKSYAFGFILHYALDRNCHPYVYYLQNKITDRSIGFNPHSAHNVIEHSIDSVMINRHFGLKNPRLFETDNALSLTDRELCEISEEISFSAEISATDAKKAISDMKNMQRLLLDKTGKKEKIITLLENAAAPFTNHFMLSAYFRTDNLEKAEKYVNIKNGTWNSPFDCKVHNESFFDLFKLSKADASEMLIKWQSGTDGAELTDNLSFLTGVEVK